MALLVALFIVVPIVEIWAIIEIGSLIGVWPTVALLIADAVLGSLLLRHQGRGAWRRFNQALAERRFPGREVADGLLIAIGGTLLLTPGFVTDIVGFFFILPLTRPITRIWLESVVARRLLGPLGEWPTSGPGTAPGSTGGPAPGPFPPRPSGGGPDVIPGEVVDRDS